MSIVTGIEIFEERSSQCPSYLAKWRGTYLLVTSGIDAVLIRP